MSQHKENPLFLLFVKGFKPENLAKKEFFIYFLSLLQGSIVLF